MRVSSGLAVLALGASVQAAPTPSSLSDLLNALITPVTSNLNQLLSSLGIQLATNGANHGPALDFHGTQCPFTFNVQPVANQFVSHVINWAQGSNPANSQDFINWRTFKANGANLGGWLEKEKTHDPVVSNLGHSDKERKRSIY